MTPTSIPEARHLILHRRVQGVGFRYSLAHEALRCGVAGWVRNRREGTVEAVIVGTAEAVAALLVLSLMTVIFARLVSLAVARIWRRYGA